jgi:hypothetical protein
VVMVGGGGEKNELYHDVNTPTNDTRTSVVGC